MVTQLEEDLLHLEGGRDRLDEHCCADRAVRDLESLLGEGEDVVPEPRLEVGLGLGQIEVGPAPPLEQLQRVVVEVQPEVDEGAHCRPAVHHEMPLVEVPAARAHNDGGEPLVGAQLVALPLGRREAERPADRVAQVDLAADDVAPVRRARVLEVGEPDSRPGVERVDRHLAVRRPGHLDAAIDEVRRRRRHHPLAVADVRRLGEEVEPPGRAPPRRDAPRARPATRPASPPNSRWSEATKANAPGVRISS